MGTRRGVGIDVTADTTNFDAGMSRASKEVNRFQKNVGRSSKRINKDFAALGDRLKGVFGGLVAAFGIRELTRMADSFKNIQARLKLATSSSEDFAKANANLVRIAQSTKAPLESTATLYTRIARSLLEVGGTQEEVAGVTESLALALRLSGASAEEAGSAMLQFSQAVASGVLRGEEFNAVNEAAPRAMQALANAIGVPTGALREMAQAGLITRDILVDAFTTQLPVLLKEAQELPETIGVAFQDLKNEGLLAIGLLDEMTKSSATTAGAIGLIGSAAIKGFAAIITGFNAASGAILSTGGAIAATLSAIFSGQFHLIGNIKDEYKSQLADIGDDVDKVIDKLTAPVALDVNIPEQDEEALQRLVAFREKLDGLGDQKKAEKAAERRAKQTQRLVESLQREAETLGFTADQIKLYDLSQRNLNQTQQDAVNLASSKISQFRIEEEFLKNNEKIVKEKAATLRALVDAQQDDSEQTAERIERTQLEIDLINESTEVQTLRLAQFEAELEFRKRIEEIKNSGLDSSQKEILAQEAIVQRTEALRAAGLESELARQREAVQQSKDIWDNFVVDFQRTVAQELTNIMNGEFDNIGVGFLKLIQKMLNDAIAADLANALFGGGGFTGGKGLLGGLIGSIFSAKGNVYENGRVVPFAKGGIIDSPIIFGGGGNLNVAGEAGAEAIIPLSRSDLGRGPDGKLGLKRRGGNEIHVHNTFPIGLDAVSRAEIAKAMPEIVKRTVEGVRQAKGRLGSQGEGL